MAATKRLTGSGSAPATCGELLQGQFFPQQDFLVTFLINWWSHAEIEIFQENDSIQVEPPGKLKSAQAARLLLDRLGYTQYGIRIKIISTIPEGKGLGSSTADITAVCRAIGSTVDIEIPPKMISSIARQIEPSDGSMYRGVVCYNHRECELIETIGDMPPCRVLVVDCGGQVNTQEFNQIPKHYSLQEQRLFSELYKKLKKAFAKSDLHEIGNITRQSAILNQRCLFKPDLDNIVSIAEKSHAVGMCTAHSGTILGIMYHPDQKEDINLAIDLVKQLDNSNIKLYQVNSL